jgi:hypothetical protein
MQSVNAYAMIDGQINVSPMEQALEIQVSTSLMNKMPRLIHGKTIIFLSMSIISVNL